MIRKIGPHNQFTGHKGMQVPTGLRTSKSELAGFYSLKFDFFDLIPIGLDFAVIIFPLVF